jgi:hypothetical protein
VPEAPGETVNAGLTIPEGGAHGAAPPLFPGAASLSPVRKALPIAFPFRSPQAASPNIMRKPVACLPHSPSPLTVTRAPPTRGNVSPSSTPVPLWPSVKPRRRPPARNLSVSPSPVHPALS